MKLTLVVRSHGRWPYLERCLDSIDDALDPDAAFDRKILSVDGPAGGAPIDAGAGWEVRSTGAQRLGLTANVRQAWADLDHDSWVFDCEEDFLIPTLDLDPMADVLRENPWVVSMVLKRQPVNPSEGSNILYGPHYAGQFVQHDGWVEQRKLWSLNPSLFHASRIEGIVPGVERDLTAQALAKGMSFGFWGGKDDPPRCEHIGVEGGMGSVGWRP